MKKEKEKIMYFRFSHWNAFTREKRFISRKIWAPNDNNISGNSVTFLQQDDISSADVASGDRFLCSIADHDSTWWGQWSKSFKCSLCFSFLLWDEMENIRKMCFHLKSGVKRWKYEKEKRWKGVFIWKEKKRKLDEW